MMSTSKSNLRLLTLNAIFVSIAIHAHTQTATAEDARGNTASWEVEVHKDVAYLGGDRQEKLDLYMPQRKESESANARRPAIVIIHGGGWHGGDKAAGREQNVGKTLAAAGYVCASINYELCPKSDSIAERLNNIWPRNLHDCKTAVRYLRAHANEYEINPSRIGAIGGSAGGHLVAMLAVTDREDGLDPDGPYSEFSCRIQAAVPMYGVHDVVAQAKVKHQLEGMSVPDRQLCRAASPITYITSDDPPALILHGTKDALVPTEQSQILYDSLSKTKVDATLHIIEGVPHSFHLQPKQEDLRATVIAFFDRHLRGD
ncbi:MAG: alpha/beta hydrolase [Planctomycetes bacterium]|nr:alpha/beta hydrolase [Planctomycetota bacterium]